MPTEVLPAPELKRSICRLLCLPTAPVLSIGNSGPSAVGRFMTTRGRFSIRAREQLNECALSSLGTRP